MQIYDCFSFFNEWDLLEIRLNELNDVVDKFVIVEADKTFSGIKKPFSFVNRLKQDTNSLLWHNWAILKKIIYLTVEIPDEIIDPWHREFFQRNSLLKGLENCGMEDIIIMGDLDEIPNKEILTDGTFAQLDKCGFIQLAQDTRYYYLNCDMNKPWNGTAIAHYYRLFNGMTIQDFRHLRNLRMIKKDVPGLLVKNGGWHFSYLGDIAKIQTKLKSFSHTEYSGEEFTNEAKIKQCMESGISLFDENQKLNFLPLNKCSLPTYVKNNIDRYQKYIK
jgi:beta-1,4-mannosyl-glycoprotein beta-1,4-N-acetylglucosaminyltransferase